MVMMMMMMMMRIMMMTMMSINISSTDLAGVLKVGEKRRMVDKNNIPSMFLFVASN